ncbi:LlaJI family restriction endonuclease [Fibrobacter sp. HC4]|uniref:LlaJI family restriction endonuclease n=1 Tax=Fibrobacter sp. HC4 TaxID=3239812 RepID=UPI00201945F1|nr:LlaJI family restriction endonuclease [Fibrobacter succinogenes]MCL4101648.1 hypothetical protein [Fibrobacter succinogenes]
MDNSAIHKSVKRQKSFKDFCVYFDPAVSSFDEDETFVGVKIRKADEQDSFEPRIYFPRGYRPDHDDSEVEKLDAELKSDFLRLISIINDVSLQNRFPDNEKSDLKTGFPIKAFFSIVQYYLDYGYFAETETVYKKGWSGKISWSRTIKRIKPQVVKDEDDNHSVVYLNLITRRTNYKQDSLITLIHKFCVYEAARLIGPLLGVIEDEFDSPELDFDYELFVEVLKDKIASTFNDKFLELFHSLLTVVDFFENKETLVNDDSEICFGFKKFDHAWEGMIDSIFGNVSDKTKYNPHLKFIAMNSKSVEGKIIDYDDDKGDGRRSTLRPDTIMKLGDSVFILDSKYYKFGVKNETRYLPGAESVCKQMAYAEYVENHMGIKADKNFNAFIIPYYAKSNVLPFGMENKGFIYGEWKVISKKDDTEKQNICEKRPYHYIACVCLDMKSVMRNYRRNEIAQFRLAEVVRSGAESILEYATKEINA